MSFERERIAPRGSRLTRREREVVEALRQYKTIHATARALGISEHTVSEHLANARSRVGATRSWELFDAV